VPDREHLIAVWFPTDPGSPRIYYDTTTENPSTLFLNYYKDQRNSITPQQAAPYPHAAMTDCSSLRAAVMPIPPGRWLVPVIIGPDGHTPAQVTTWSLTTQKETSANPSLWHSPTTLTDHPPQQTRHPRVIPYPLCRPAQHFGKRWIRVVKKTTVFRSSAVSSAPHSHHPLRRKSSMVTATTAQLPPRSHADSPPGPAPSQFPRSMASLNAARPAQLYSCAIQQRRRPTPTRNARH